MTTMIEFEPQDERALLVSYLTLRRILGLLGFFLPIVLLVEGWLLNARIQSSISAYYDLDRPRDVLVGTLFAIGFFLLTYRGYERKDDRAGNGAFVFALGVALFRYNGPGLIGVVHHVSAAGLFLLLAYYSLFLFTKSSGRKTREKRIRNRIYRICGAAIVACLAVAALHWIYARVTGANAREWQGLFWLESVALWAFGISWLVKGETLWRDAGLPPAMRPAERRVAAGV